MEQEARRCRVCGCTDDDCHQCIEKTGVPCHWVEADLCSACADETDDDPNLDSEDGDLCMDEDFYDDEDDYDDGEDPYEDYD